MWRPTRPWPRAAVVVLVALAAVPLGSRVALAHGEMEEPEPEATAGPREGEAAHEGEELETPVLELRVPEEAELGGTITIRAVLTDPHDGAPVRGAPITFETPAVWGEELQGHIVIGTAETDRSGVATITTQLRTSGDVQLEAVFGGGGGFAPATSEASLAVRGTRQLYSPKAGIRVPWLNLWVLAGVIAFVWTLYFLVGLRVLAIARPSSRGGAEAPVLPAPGTTTRRQFLGRLLPVGAQAGIASLGAGLVTVVARSPRTHGNLMAPPSTVDYRRTPVAHVGHVTEMRAMPPPLDREVSFSREVLPVFMTHGGPHVVLPESSPPPGGLRLDTYEQVTAKEGVVVPGKPEASELVEHLLSPGMQMPPSVPPLPDDVIRVIVTWISQGAKDN